MLEIQQGKDAVTILVRVLPCTSPSEVVGETAGALKIRVQAPALENRANQELIAFLAELLKTPKAAVRISSGERSRVKRVELRGVTREQVLRLLEHEA
jgi:uncharacterized protein